MQLNASALNKIVEVLKGEDPAHLLSAVQVQIATLEQQLPAELMADYLAFKKLEEELVKELTTVEPVAPLVESPIEPAVEVPAQETYPNIG